jgi:protein disulfide-isomerase A6
VWDALADDFALESDVLVAKVDAEAGNSRATAEDQGVVSYPTIKYFPKGSKDPENYDGGRSESDFVQFLNLKAGTHRMVGGGLDNKAGTVDSLDSIIAKYVSGDSLAKITEEARGVAKDLQQKYAPYYVKVLDKLGSNAGYAAKELARLEKLLSKGGLAAEKADDLTSRSNILRRFLTKEKGKEEL